MDQIFDDWEIVDKKLRSGVKRFFFIFFASLLEAKVDATWTVRDRTTGEVKRVTANSLSAAARLIAKGAFDPE